MKTKLLFLTAVCTALATGRLTAQTNCSFDRNGFVNYKNSASVAAYMLGYGAIDKAAQTYHYKGPGRIMGVRVYGSNPNSGNILTQLVRLRVSVHSVDISGRPTSSLVTSALTWSTVNNSAGYMDFNFPGGEAVSDKFAISVQVLNWFFSGNQFNLGYTGDGEGGGQDLASLSGNTTGGVWASAKNTFSKDGDFFLVPIMEHQNIPSFTTGSNCFSINAPISFSNTTQMTADSMFNRINLAGYSGSNFVYTWNFGDGSPVSHLKSPVHSYTAGGLYTVTLTTTIEGWQGNCVRTYTGSLSVGLSLATASAMNVSCFAGTNGSFAAVAQNGAPSYSYSANYQPWQTSPVFTGLGAGTYTLFVMDSKFCANSTVVIITQPAPIVPTSVFNTNSTCGSSNGAISLSAIGGTGTLQFRLNSGSFQSSGSFTGVPAGTHTVTIQDAAGCQTTTLITVNDLAGPVQGNPVVANVSCFGGNDGNITLSASGGTGQKLYSIDGGTTFTSNPIFLNLPAGVYNTVVKDNAGCTSYSSATVMQGPQMAVTATSSPVSCNGGNNGQISVQSAGGTGLHNYSINGLQYQSGSVFTGLTAAVYTVYVRDVLNCVITTTMSIVQPAALTSSLTVAPALCYGSQNGSISATAGGGTSGYQFSLNGSLFNPSGAFLYLPAGTYTVVTRDANMCTTSAAITVTQPPQITTTVNTTNSTCTFTNGSVMVLAAGGSGSGYQFSINGGSTFTSSGLFSPLAAGKYFLIVRDGSSCEIVTEATILDSNGPQITSSSHQNVSCYMGHDGAITISGVTGGSGQLQYSIDGVTWQTSPVFSNLMAGMYVVQVKDANGCIGQVTIVLAQPNPFLVTVSTGSVKCHGDASGSATISASGGSGFLGYSINNGMSYQSSPSFAGLAAGNYTLLVKDVANCQAVSSFSIQQPSPIQLLTLGVLNVTCYGANNGQIFLAATGGVGPYDYSNNGGPFINPGVFSGLAGAKNHTVVIRDAQNCTVSTNIYVEQPSSVVVSGLALNVKCAGGKSGSIILNVSGGVSPYGYAWSTGANGPAIAGLNGGVYSATVTDHNGCVSKHTYTVTEPTNPLILNSVITQPTDPGAADGAIDLTVTGGVPPYQFNWSNGATGEDLSGLLSGAYLVTVTDANGCTASSTYLIGGPTSIVEMTNGSVLIFPNPASESVKIRSGVKIRSVSIMNLLGQDVIQKHVDGAEAEIDIRSLAAGQYIMSIESEGKPIVRRLVVAR